MHASARPLLHEMSYIEDLNSLHVYVPEDRWNLENYKLVGQRRTQNPLRRETETGI
jgi:hypothetical protein